MNKLLHLLFIDIKLLSKTKVFYLKLILFPCILILILGTIFGNSNSKLTSFDVAFCNRDTVIVKGTNKLSLGESLQDEVLASKTSKELFTLKEVKSYSKGKRMVKEKKAVTFIYVPENFTKGYLSGKKAEIKLIGDSNKQIEKGIVKNITDSFVKNLQTIKIEENVLNNLQSSKISKAKINDVFNKIRHTSHGFQSIKSVSTNKHAKPIDIMQYEAIAMIVMFSILTAFELAHNIVSDKLNNIQFRIKSTPTYDIQYLLGKVIGIILAIVVQMSVVMLISHLAFKVNFGNVFAILLTSISYGFAIGAIVFCAGTAAKDQMSISSFASIILYGFSFLGGSFIEKDSLPQSLQLIQKIIPNGKAINCYLKLCQGGNISDILGDLLGLILIGLVFLVLSLNLYRERSFIGNENIDNDQKPVKTAV